MSEELDRTLSIGASTLHRKKSEVARKRKLNRRCRKRKERAHGTQARGASDTVKNWPEKGRNGSEVIAVPSKTSKNGGTRGNFRSKKSIDKQPAVKGGANGKITGVTDNRLITLHRAGS